MPLRELHTDNGGEFLNYPLQEYCRAEGIRTTRGRPYKKNDQAFVEQKNGGVIRRWVGYDRYSSKAAAHLLRRLYAALRPYVNFFQPVQKLVHKQREGAKVHKTYDAPRTPYQRLLVAGILSPDQAARLRAQYEGLNPAQLRREIDACLDALLKHIDHSKERPLSNTTSEATQSAAYWKHVHSWKKFAHGLQQPQDAGCLAEQIGRDRWRGASEGCKIPSPSRRY